MTMVATLARSFRPRTFPSRASRRRSSSVRRSRFPELSPEDPVLLDEVLDDALLVAVHPAGEEGQEEDQGGAGCSGRHGSFQIRWARAAFCSAVGRGSPLEETPCKSAVRIGTLRFRGNGHAGDWLRSGGMSDVVEEEPRDR